MQRLGQNRKINKSWRKNNAKVGSTGEARGWDAGGNLRLGWSKWRPQVFLGWWWWWSSVGWENVSAELLQSVCILNKSQFCLTSLWFLQHQIKTNSWTVWTLTKIISEMKSLPLHDMWSFLDVHFLSFDKHRYKGSLSLPWLEVFEVPPLSISSLLTVYI